MVKTKKMSMPGKIRRAQKVQILPEDTSLFGLNNLGICLQQVQGLTAKELDDAKTFLEAGQRAFATSWRITTKRGSAGKMLSFTRADKTGSRATDFQRNTLRTAECIIRVCSHPVSSGMRLVDDLNQESTPALVVGDTATDTTTIGKDVIKAVLSLCNDYSCYILSDEPFDEDVFEEIAALVSSIVPELSSKKLGKLNVNQANYGAFKQVFVNFLFLQDYLAAMSAVFPIYRANKTSGVSGAADGKPDLMRRLSEMNVTVKLANYSSEVVPKYLGSETAVLVSKLIRSEIISNLIKGHDDGSSSLVKAYKLDAHGLSINQELITRLADEIAVSLSNDLLPAIKRIRELYDYKDSLYQYIGLSIVFAMLKETEISEDIRILYKIYEDDVNTSFFNSANKYTLASAEDVEIALKAAKFDCEELASAILRWIRALYRDTSFSDTGVYETYIVWKNNQKWFARIDQMSTEPLIKTKALSRLNLTPQSASGAKKIVDNSDATVSVSGSRGKLPYSFKLSAVEPEAARVTTHVETHESQLTAFQTRPDKGEGWYTVGQVNQTAVHIDKSSVCEWLRQSSCFLELSYDEVAKTVQFVKRFAAYAVKPVSIMNEGVFVGDWMHTGTRADYSVEPIVEIEDNTHDASQDVCALLFSFPSKDVLNKTSKELMELYSSRVAALTTSQVSAIPDTLYGSIAALSCIDFAAVYLAAIAGEQGGLEVVQKMLATIWLPDQVFARNLFDSAPTASDADINYQPVRAFTIAGRYLLCELDLPSPFFKSSVIEYFLQNDGEDQVYKAGNVILKRPFCNAKPNEVQNITHRVTVTRVPGDATMDLLRCKMVIDLGTDVTFSSGSATEVFDISDREFKLNTLAHYEYGQLNLPPREMATLRIISADGVCPFNQVFKDKALIKSTLTSDQNALEIIKKMTASACAMLCARNVKKERLFNWAIFGYSLYQYNQKLKERFNSAVTSLAELGIASNAQTLVDFSDLLTQIVRLIYSYNKDGKVQTADKADPLRDKLLELYHMLYGREYSEIDCLASDIFPCSSFDAGLITACYETSSVLLQKPTLVQNVAADAITVPFTDDARVFVSSYVQTYVNRFFEHFLTGGKHGVSQDGTPTFDDLRLVLKGDGVASGTVKVVTVESHTGNSDPECNILKNLLLGATGIHYTITQAFFDDDGKNTISFISSNADATKATLEGVGYTVKVSDLAVEGDNEHDIVLVFDAKEDEIKASLEKVKSLLRTTRNKFDDKAIKNLGDNRYSLPADITRAELTQITMLLGSTGRPAALPKEGSDGSKTKSDSTETKN